MRGARLRVHSLLRALYPGVNVDTWSWTRYLGLVPVTLVLLIVACGYVAIVPVVLWPLLASRPLLASLGLLLLHFLMLNLLWSYAAVILVDPGRVPPSWSFAVRGWPRELRGSETAANAAAELLEAGLASRPRDYNVDEEAAMMKGTGGGGGSDSNNGRASASSTAVLQFVSSGDLRLPATTRMRNSYGRQRFCAHCHAYKPDRAHHCSTLGRCVLKMDHFCPWTNNTIGHLNQKFFVQFLYYALAACLFVSVFALPSILARLSASTGGGRRGAVAGAGGAGGGGDALLAIVAMVGWVLSLMFAFALLFFAAFHTYLVLKNRTTIEAYEVTDPARAELVQRLDLGWRENWRLVFGARPLLWLFPVHAASISGDGTWWKFNSEPMHAYV